MAYNGQAFDAGQAKLRVIWIHANQRESRRRANVRVETRERKMGTYTTWPLLLI